MNLYHKTTKSKLMKTRLLVSALAGLLWAVAAQAQLAIPSDGSDGAFNPPSDPAEVVVDLSQAVTGKWDANNSANAGKGIYDPDKWAVVFKYSWVNIPGVLDTNGQVIGVTVRFINHPSRAPVVWLVQGNVVINGIVDLDGQAAQAGPPALLPTEAGPGGFRGGPVGPQGIGAGLGPGGGGGGGAGGVYAGAYGNPQVIPLIGGSGASGYADFSGGAGGGAVLVAATGTLQLDGRITAKGADAVRVWTQGGSGGAVRIIAGQVLGGGEINCLGGRTLYNTGYVVGSLEAAGRIRIESLLLSASVRTYPETIVVPPATPPIIWPPDNAPKVRIVSVDAVNAPADPTAPLVSSADIGIQNDQPVVVVLETRDFPIEGDVSVRVAQKWGGFTWLKASYVGGNQALATWSLTNTFVKGFTTLQARATAP